MGNWIGWKLEYDKRNANRSLEELISGMNLDDSIEIIEEVGDICPRQDANEPDKISTLSKIGIATSIKEQKVLIDAMHQVSPATWIKLVSEKGNNTSDSYIRNESIYIPESNRLLIGEVDYSYGNGTAFDEYVEDGLFEEHGTRFTTKEYKPGKVDSKSITKLCKKFGFTQDAFIKLLNLSEKLDDATAETPNEINKIQQDLHEQALAAIKPKIKKGELKKIISNPLSSTKTLETIWNALGDGDDLRFRIVFHPNVSEGILRKASDDFMAEEICECILDYPNASITLLRWLSECKGLYAVDWQGTIAGHPNITEELVVELSQSKKSSARLVAATSLKTPKEILEKLATDKDKGVSRWANENLAGNITEDTFGV